LRTSGDYHPRSNHIIINWGNSSHPSWYKQNQKWINKPVKVALATNKLWTFEQLKQANIPTPDWTTSKETAQQWINEGKIVFGRELLTGHSGQGIVLMQNSMPNIPCPLYTKYTKCKEEYRVHVINNQVIDFVMKKKRNGVQANPHIRSHNYGWIFARGEVTLPDKVKEAAIGAIQALGLDFGAIDIGYNVYKDKAFVYEVNTAPGLESTTLNIYIQEFKENYLV
jgi:glutathione synthase/RimK-type ligase-like ATP-grasp enzyme